MIGVVVNGQEIALYDIEGQVFATDDICTHAYAKLSDGWFDKGEIECPLHAGRFDARTGKATAPPCVDDLKTYPVKTTLPCASTATLPSRSRSRGGGFRYLSRSTHLTERPYPYTRRYSSMISSLDGTRGLLAGEPEAMAWLAIVGSSSS